MPQPEEDTISALERARERLYTPGALIQDMRVPLSNAHEETVPHAWEEKPPEITPPPRGGGRHVHFASIFFLTSLLFFLISLGGVAYFFYYGGNSVSVDKITIDTQGPSTISGGDTVPLSFTVTNRNSVAIDNAIIEIDFPDGTRNAEDVLAAYPRYIENIGTIPSGGTITRSVKAIIFGGESQSLSLPISFSYGTQGSNATFVKKSSYALTISSTPLSLSVDTLTETVSGKPITLMLTVRSNATTPLSNVVLANTFPFGFSLASSSLPLTDSSFVIGTILPGAQKTITLTGTLMGQDKEQRVFHFTVGTAKSAQDHSLAVSYMTQQATVAIVSPFINTNISVNGNTGDNTVVSPGSTQNITVSYANTLSTSVTNATVSITISGSAVDYDSIRAQSGFYRSVDHTIIFSRDTDPALGTLAPGASGVGAFTFSTLPSGSLIASPTITFTISVSGTRVGQSNVPEQVNASVTKTAKVVTAVVLAVNTLHNSGPIVETGSIPPKVNTPTNYTILFTVQNKGSAVAGGSVSTILPVYVTYPGTTAGSGTFLYDQSSHTVSWNPGDLAQGATIQGAFQISITPSSSQKGSAPALTGNVFFSGYDRFAGVQVTAKVDPVTTDTKGDSSYIPGNAIVQ